MIKSVFNEKNMNRFKIITISSIIIAVIAIIAITVNMAGLYRSVKKQTMDVVKECAVNADLLEMISRMEKSYKASNSYIRLNDIIEQVQQKNGKTADSDTVNTSLASLLRLGLEFADNKHTTDFNNLDSIFRQELARHGLTPSKAMILPIDSGLSHNESWWTQELSMSPSRKPDYRISVSPMPGKVLSQMWGIIIPLSTAVAIFTFLSAFLIHTVGKLRTIEQMKDDFTHNMTHELKTPVAVAFSAADSMLRYYDQSDEARNKRFLTIIMQRLSYLSGMIENILSMSMERFKSMKLNIETVAVKPIVEEISEMVRLKAAKPVKISIEIPDGLSVSTDQLHFSNIISNLLDNAVKYSEDSVEITIKAESGMITVSDNGIGIEKRNLPHIFEKFYRVTSGDRYEVGGYGLGLFYVKNIIDMLGWDIEVASTPGEGSRFIIKFKGNEKG